MSASLLPVALEAVAIANDLVRHRLPGIVTAKGDRDMATEVDYAVERAVREFLLAKTPDLGFLGEEEGPSPSGGGELQWTLDPVDGTANFLHGLPLCAVSLGLVRGRRPVLGVIDLPFLDARYSAAEGTGAYRGYRALRVSRTTDLNDAVVAIGDYAVGDGSTAKNHQRLAVTSEFAARAQRVRMLGSSAVDLAWVAEGRLDAAVMLSNNPWDTAAGVVIAREAGAVVRDRDGTEHTLDSAATIAAPPTLMGEVLGLVRRQLDPDG